MTAPMQKTYTGSCQCGEVRYAVKGEPLTVFACHCTECQRQSSSAFGMALWIRNYHVETSGTPVKEWVRTMPSGRQMACRFCPNCGTRLFHQVLGQDVVMSIKPGTLDDTRQLQLAGHIWTDSAQPWLGPLPGLCYGGNPDSFDALIAAWSDLGAAEETR